MERSGQTSSYPYPKTSGPRACGARTTEQIFRWIEAEPEPTVRRRVAILPTDLRSRSLPASAPSTPPASPTMRESDGCDPEHRNYVLILQSMGHGQDRPLPLRGLPTAIDTRALMASTPRKVCACSCRTPRPRSNT